MINESIQISIITLTKNDPKNFLNTLESIIFQEINFKIEWLIIDGSNKKIQTYRNKLINKYSINLNEKLISIRHINSKDMGISGIYPCMNLGKKISKGNFLIFLNSGDVFYTKNSLKILFKKSFNLSSKKSIIFGQANIISTNNIEWNFPGNRLSNINIWLKFFEPNHQAMLVSKKLAKKYDFPIIYDSLGDGFWKRKILAKAIDIVYVKRPIVKFFLNGISSTKPSKKVLKNIFKNKNISFQRKLIILIKYIFPSELFFIYNLLQKWKSFFIDLIF